LKNSKKEQKEKEKEFLKENKKLSKKIRKLENKPNRVTINNNNNTNTDNSIVNNVQLNSYGFENTSYLENKEFIEKIKKLPNLLGLLEYENRIYCDPNHQENWNIGITNLKHDTCRVYENQQWKTKKASEVISTNFMKGIGNLGDSMEIVAHKLGRKLDKNGVILDKKEQTIIDNYDKGTCSDVMNDFYVKKLNDVMDRHKKYIYDHTALFLKIYRQRGM